MKLHLSISILLLVAISPARAQLASSHAPTGVANSPLSEAVAKPVARVNGAVLTEGDLVREEYTIFPYARTHNGIPRGLEPDIRAGALKMIEFEELVYQEAQRRKLTVPAARLQGAEVEFRKQFTDPQDYQNLLNTEFKGSKALLRSKIERSLLIEQMLKTEVEDRSYVSIAQARAFYDKNPDRFRVPESYAVQTISIIPPNNATPEQLKEARKKAEDALRQAKQTKSYDEFGVLAEKISEDDYRVMMGDHRALPKAKLPPPVADAVEKMQPGQVSDLIDIGGNGCTILRMYGHIPAGMQKFEEVKETIREQMKRQKAEELRKTLDAKLRKNARIEEL